MTSFALPNNFVCLHIIPNAAHFLGRGPPLKTVWCPSNPPKWETQAKLKRKRLPNTSRSCFQVLLTSEASGQLWSVCVWDVHTGTSLLSYRSGGAGAAAAPRTLTLLNNQHLLTAVTNKQLIHVWALQRKV